MLSSIYIIRGTPTIHQNSTMALDETTRLYSPKVRRAMSDTIFDAELSPTLEEARSAKRNFSEVSVSSRDSILQAKASKASEDDDSDEYLCLLRNEVSKPIDAAIKLLEKNLKAQDHGLEVLVKQWHAGAMDISKSEYEADVKKLETEIGNLSTNLVVAKTSAHALKGAIMDAHTWFEGQETADWAYIDLLIGRYKEPHNATHSPFRPRDPDSQARFRVDVLKSYGAYRSSKEKSPLWCVVSGRYRPARGIVAAHIVRYNVGELSAIHLFGTPDQKNGHIMNPRNGLPMQEEYETLLDEARIAFVPANEAGDEWKITVLDKTLLSETVEAADSIVEPWGKDLDGRLLTFPPNVEFRPGKRYLYFNFCVNVLRRQRHEVQGWWRDRIDYRGQRIWATPGYYLRKSTLTTLAHRIGHVDPSETPLLVERLGSTSGGSQASSKKGDEVLAETILSNTSDECSKSPSESERFEDDTYLYSFHTQNQFDTLGLEDENEDEDEGR